MSYIRNLGQLKAFTLKLIDEYEGDDLKLADDDIVALLPDLFNAGQIEISIIAKINRLFEFDIIDKSDELYRTVILPKDFREIKNLRYFSTNNTRLDYRLLEDNAEYKLKIHKDNLGTFELQYYAKPKMITEKTEETYEFNLSQEAQELLAYYAAADILKSDVSANYTAFEYKYNAKMEYLKSINQTKKNIMVEINPIFDI